MPRIARVVGVEYPHHITQRGNYRQEIFLDDEDRKKYLTLLFAESNKYRLKILSYCLMTNHVHFIGVPEKMDSMGNVFKYVNMKYSQYFNRKQGEKGHLFHGRFFSSIMDEHYTMACARYIERNPVRAKMVKDPWDWKWSSAGVHCGMEKESELLENRLFEYCEIDGKEWKGYISSREDPGEMIMIKGQTIKGRPLAGGDFIKELGKKLKRVLEVRPKGRPVKKTEKKQKNRCLSLFTLCPYLLYLLELQ